MITASTGLYLYGQAQANSLWGNLIVNASGCLEEQTFVPGSDLEYIGGLLDNQVLYVTEVAVFGDLAKIV